ncbi:MAG: nickel pincer cofactor biosynthesis protein LarB [Thermomicrobiales bacterium]|nr:nickel pincer cofactor biosynthesis protein LarB [Thermomicrobiales bacterium]
MSDPFVDMIRALNAARSDMIDETLDVRSDTNRRQRTGAPEIVFGEGKSDEQIVTACRSLLSVNPRVIVSRINRERAEGVAAAIGAVEIQQPFAGRTCVVVRDAAERAEALGRIAVITAGTSDLAVAGEAATVASELGCDVTLIADVGVAGLHRLVQPLRSLVASGVSALIVAAGMDGALPTVVAGLVDVPVIGLPTSVGYGVATGGNAALGTMLASCVPGLAVVNIDNGVGAGVFAARIVNAGVKST